MWQINNHEKKHLLELGIRKLIEAIAEPVPLAEAFHSYLRENKKII